METYQQTSILETISPCFNASDQINKANKIQEFQKKYSLYLEPCKRESQQLLNKRQKFQNQTQLSLGSADTIKNFLEFKEKLKINNFDQDTNVKLSSQSSIETATSLNPSGISSQLLNELDDQEKNHFTKKIGKILNEKSINDIIFSQNLIKQNKSLFSATKLNDQRSAINLIDCSDLKINVAEKNQNILQQYDQSQSKNDINQENQFKNNQNENLFNENMDDKFSLGEFFLQNNFEVIAILGEGMQGKVLKVRNIQTNEILAAKTFRNVDDEMRDSIENEYKIMQNLNHSKILKIHDLIYSKNHQQPILLMEYFEGSSLKDLDKDTISDGNKCDIILQLLETVLYLHSQNIMHRDIQPRNVLYNPRTKQIKLIDFGISKQVFELSQSFTVCGSKMYQAPEMFNDESYTHKVDIWQVGQIFFEMMERYQISSKKLFKLIKTNKLQFKYSSSQISLFIQTLLEINHHQRIDAAQAYQNLTNLLINEEIFLNNKKF